MKFYSLLDAVKIIEYMEMEFDIERHDEFKKILKHRYDSLEDKNMNLYRLVLLTRKVYSEFMSDNQEDLEKILIEKFADRMYSDPCFFMDLERVIKPKEIIISSTMN